jgi:phosphoribosylglycinamide formyltransferase 1
VPESSVLRLVVLISGGGSNLRALLEAAADDGFPARIVAIGADRDAEGLAHAEEFGIPSFVVPFGAFPSREEWGDELLAQIRQWEPDLVVLSGFMRLLPPRAVDALSPDLLNTHPAYLPEFPGAHAVRDAMAAGVSETGASVIVVDSGVDTGPIVAQRRIPVLPGDTEARLHDRIKLVERELLVDVVLDIADGRIDLAALTS